MWVWYWWEVSHFSSAERKDKLFKEEADFLGTSMILLLSKLDWENQPTLNLLSLLSLPFHIK